MTRIADGRAATMALLLTACSAAEPVSTTAPDPIDDSASDTGTAPLPPFAVCADTSAATVAPPPDWATEVEPLFDACVSCHRSNPTGLVFQDPHAELVDVPAAELASMDRVEPGDLQQSYLWHKLCDTHDAVGGSGDPMPVQGDLTEEEVVRIAAWILGGAPTR